MCGFALAIYRDNHSKKRKKEKIKTVKQPVLDDLSWNDQLSNN